MLTRKFECNHHLLRHKKARFFQRRQSLDEILPPRELIPFPQWDQYHKLAVLRHRLKWTVTIELHHPHHPHPPLKLLSHAEKRAFLCTIRCDSCARKMNANSTQDPRTDTTTSCMCRRDWKKRIGLGCLRGNLENSTQHKPWKSHWISRHSSQHQSQTLAAQERNSTWTLVKRKFYRQSNNANIHTYRMQIAAHAWWSLTRITFLRLCVCVCPQFSREWRAPRSRSIWSEILFNGAIFCTRFPFGICAKVNHFSLYL